jgi:geranylgeranyl diphosphate synthase type I
MKPGGNGHAALVGALTPEAFLMDASELMQPLVEEILTAGISAGHHGAMVYQVGSGGKRMRPALAIAACLLLDGSLDDVLYAAASVEVLHNATLITDDIIDHGETRRGLPTMWKQQGQAFAECSALAYTASVYEGLARQGRLDLAPILTNAMKAVVDGELMDILFEDSGREDEGFVRANRPEDVTLPDFAAMIACKTAELFAASAELGGACANGSPEQLSALRGYGVNFGMLFQMQDDILDIYGDERAFGKQIGKDIIEHKRGNAVLLLGLQTMDPGSRARCMSIMRRAELAGDGLSEVLAGLESVRAREQAAALSGQYATAAKKALCDLPESPWLEVLSDLVDFCLDRQR